jgi:hypothetical protein
MILEIFYKKENIFPPQMLKVSWALGFTQSLTETEENISGDQSMAGA